MGLRSGWQRLHLLRPHACGLHTVREVPRTRCSEPLARTARCVSLPLPSLFPPQAAVPAAPPWLAERSRFFEELWTAQEKRLRGRLAREPRPIEVSLPGGRKVAAQAWRSTPYAVARQIRCPGVGLGRLPRLLALPASGSSGKGPCEGTPPLG